MFVLYLPRALVWILVVVAAAVPAGGKPTIVATAEGQIGETPGLDDQIIGQRFESIRGQAGELLLGGIFVFGGAMPPPPAMSFVTDLIHGSPNPAPVASVVATFDNVFKVPPGSARALNTAGDGDFVAFSFAVDGAQPQTMSVRLATFDETGSALADVPLAEVGTFPDPVFNSTGVAVDDQGRVTVVYTDLPAGNPPRVKARRVDAVTGALLGGEIPVTGDGRVSPGVALLDPAGDRLVIPATDFGTIRGNVLDVSGPTPQALPEFPISTTPGFANVHPAVAADPSTGAFVVAWENVTAVQGDPVNVRARRFDAQGNPVGNDFLVNTTTANAQGQAAVAVGPGGESVIVWAGDGETAADALDVFAQAYDAAGQPIGGEIRVNAGTQGAQDRPSVRFLPEPDLQGRTQFAVVWRDVEEGGDTPRGTGTGYRCFAIDEPSELPAEIFADGFESGDTSSWSVTRN